MLLSLINVLYFYLLKVKVSLNYRNFARLGQLRLINFFQLECVKYY